MTSTRASSRTSRTAGTHIDGVDLEALASRVGTPFHAYSASMIRERIGALRAALQGLSAEICYAVKANSNLALLQLMAAAGLGADVVSGGEMQRALRAGTAPGRIAFSGVGKTAAEITGALAAGIARFNVESADELDLLQRLAAARNVTARASVRVNPGVDAHTNAKIATGKSENKFGVGVDEARRWFGDAAPLTHVRLDGLHVHIGSQIMSLDPIRRGVRRVATLWRELAAAGHAIEVIDVGGGLGVCYREGRDRPPEVGDYVDLIRQELDGFAGRILLEPGRWLVAEAGVLATRVIRVKPGHERQFLVVDAAMNDFLRPSLYDAWHDIVPVAHRQRPRHRYDVVGPVCETGDTFARDRELPECRAGDLMLIKGTGAYGASMASNYNSRPLAAEVLLDRGRYAVVRHRQTLDEMTAGEQPATHWGAT